MSAFPELPLATQLTARLGTNVVPDITARQELQRSNHVQLIHTIRRMGKVSANRVLQGVAALARECLLPLIVL